MQKLAHIVGALDDLFKIERVDIDPAFRHFVPMAYDPIDVDWRGYFEPAFCTRFNGLMIRGHEDVGAVFCGVFPSETVIDQFIRQAQPGDLFFSHHALDMKMGDPRGKSQPEPFIMPIPEAQLRAMREIGLSYYSCHIPMDLNWRIGTTAAIVETLGATVIDHFYEGDYGPYGAICELAPRSTDALIAELIAAMDIPYGEFLGPKHNELRRIAVVAGAGTRVDLYKEAEAKGAQAYVTGEIRNHIDNDIGRSRDALIMEYAKTTPMSLIGTSHAASEYLVMKTQMKAWFEDVMHSEVHLLPEDHWWR
ncbi:MAG: Nif3-like dinuclear metal center hexameric protein [Capsulimonas sp.]|uniref:Nif3-like dinuclear metal center hexameric protein n=1 Tax=Capsulimonas sp. TaxID=2494211 RepID=UPI00326613D2